MDPRKWESMSGSGRNVFMLMSNHPGVRGGPFEIRPAAACVLTVIAALWRWHEPAAVCLLVGGALYLVGSLLVTGGCHVPRNESLASVAPGHPDAARLWTNYLAAWTAWNHVRTAAALAAAVSFSLALRC
jgi:uncharacterized membrane protein